jgi:hypothetical protein
MTHEKRLEEYAKARDTILEDKKSNGLTCFCFCLDWNLTRENYPELYAHKPWYVMDRGRGNFFNLVRLTPYWFSTHDYDSRIRILDKIMRGTGINKNDATNTP